MDRRDSLKTLLIGTIAGASLTTAASCGPDAPATPPENDTEPGLYGRTPEEIAHDKKVIADVFLNEHELTTIAILCDIILPATPTAGSATEAGVDDFIDFIVKDIPSHQIPLRGGLMWLDTESKSRFGKVFRELSSDQQIEIVEDIAYPDPEGKKPELSQGISFFERMRNLTLTGYYTSKVGIKDLGYVGNIPNVWDGVPEEVLAEHEVAYEPEWLAKCIDQSKRDVIAEWDEDMNLIS